MFCIIYTSARLNAVHFSELEQKGPDLSPQAKDFQPGNVPLRRLYLIHLSTFPPPLVAIHFPSLFSSLHLFFQISSHSCPSLALIFICVLPCPTEGMQLSFDGARGGFWSELAYVLKTAYPEKLVSILSHAKSIKESFLKSRESDRTALLREAPPLGRGRKMRSEYLALDRFCRANSRLCHQYIEQLKTWGGFGHLCCARHCAKHFVPPCILVKTL